MNMNQICLIVGFLQAIGWGWSESVHAQQTLTHYVNAANPNPVAPYTSWNTAATNIQDAISAGTQAGCLVVVSNGVYRAGSVETNGLNRVALTNAVMVRSVNGPDVTVIEGGETEVQNETGGFDTARCAYVGNGSVLSGFTLTRGNALSGGGVFSESSGIVTNCLFVSNRAESGGGAYGGTLYKCVLISNSAHEGGGANGSTLFNCTLKANAVFSHYLLPSIVHGVGSGAYRCTLFDSTLTENAASGAVGSAPIRRLAAGGGASESTLYRCTLTNNFALVGGGAHASTLYDCLLNANAGGGAFGGTLNNCRLSQNTGEGATGATLYNCIATGNSASGANGGTLYNCTVTGNSGGGVIEGATLYNCIVYFNNGPNYTNSVFEYSCTTPLPPGPGNIDAGPRFLDAPAGDFRLSCDSPCVDSGTNLVSLIPTDIEGHPRLLDGNGDGIVAFDMGAYESTRPAFIDAGPDLPAAALDVTYKISLQIGCGTAPYSLAVIAGGLPPGLSLDSGGTISGKATQSGSFTFTLEVTDSLGQQSRAERQLLVKTLTLESARVPGVATPGFDFSTLLHANYGTEPYKFALVSGALPPGLALSSSGFISGIPNSTGSFTFTVRVTDAASHAAEKEFALLVSDFVEGLVGHWSFDEGQGIIARDWSGSRNDGVLKAGVNWAEGWIGKALEFNWRFDSFVQVPSSASLNVSTGLSICAWIKSSNTDGAHVIVSKWDDTARQWSYIFQEDSDSGMLRIELSKNINHDLVALGGSRPILLGQWMHVATTYDAATGVVRLFVNGDLDSEATSSGGPIQPCLANLQIGAIGTQNTGGVFEGLIDEVALFNRALPPEEIQKLYRQGFGATTQLPAFTHVVVSTTGLELRWNDAARGMKLQQAPTLTNPVWQDVPGSETTNTITLHIAGSSAFFRLVKP
ncbi:MAG: putative Ig domain-containing protein [Verrucomicrobia bacterium]|nr:putative Ig domain-containing protein [Verrucomicrobiota bacterium]